jgi:hypothetical protein
MAVISINNVINIANIKEDSSLETITFILKKYFGEIYSFKISGTNYFLIHGFKQSILHKLENAEEEVIKKLREIIKNKFKEEYIKLLLEVEEI